MRMTVRLTRAALLTIALAVTGWVCAAASDAAAAPVNGAAAGEGATATVTVEAVWDFNSTSLPRCVVRQITAWRGGKVRFSVNGSIGLKVGRVIEGRLADPAFLERPVGVALLDVIPLDGAAAGVDANGGKVARGVWRLTRLPDGEYAVLELSDTPLGGPEADAEMQKTAQMVRDLESDDPQTQYKGLCAFGERYCMTQVPLVIGMLDSQALVTVWDGRFVDREGFSETQPGERTLGLEASRSLQRIGVRLAGADRPAMISSTKEWTACWERVLRTESFPKVVEKDVESRTVLSLRLNQTWPEAVVREDGRFAVISATRLEQPLDGMASGLCLLNLLSGRADWVYRIERPARGENSPEPQDLRVAWGRDAVSIIFSEWDRPFFMSVDYSGRVVAERRELVVKDVAGATLAADGDAWLLAYVTKKSALGVVRLDRKGDVVGEAVRLAPELDERETRRVAAVSLDDGVAVAFHDDRQLTLAMLDRGLGVRTRVRVHDAGSPEYRSSMPRVAWNGQCVLVAWAEARANVPERLCSRVFDRGGKALSAARVLAEEATYSVEAVPYGKKGFVVGWVDDSIVPRLARVTMVDNDGQTGPTIGMGRGYSIGVGQNGDVARVLRYDWSKYPGEFVLSSVSLGALGR